MTADAPDDGNVAPTATDWITKATEELASARVLARDGLWQQAFGHAGFAVECALKYRIMIASGLNRWPERKERRDLYSHDLSHLAKLGALEPLLSAAIQAGDQIGMDWLVAKDWDNEIKYDPRRFPERRATDMIEACERLVPWIRTRPI